MSEKIEQLINFNGIRPPAELVERIFEKVDATNILRWYFGRDFKIGQKYSSPFRKDKDPSFGFFYSEKYGTVIGHDFKSGRIYDCVNFVKALYNINYAQAIIRIAVDFGIVQGYKDEVKVKQEDLRRLEEFRENLVEEEFKYQVIIKNFSESELEWWKQYNITKPTLSKFHVFSVLRVYVNGTPWSKLKGIKFAYYFPSTKRLKIYCPEEDPERKWRTNTSADIDIYGYEQLPETGDLLIVTKSLKDVMTLYSLGYTAISFQSESINGTPEFMQEMKRRFKRIVTLMDNDRAGIQRSEFFLEKYNIQPLLIPNWYGTKDISDTIALYGVEQVNKLIKSMLSDNTKEQREVVVALHNYFNELLDVMGLNPSNVADVKRVDDVIYIQTKDGRCEAITKMICEKDNDRGIEAK